MSNFENSKLLIRKLPESTQSFDEIFDEIVDNDRIESPDENMRLFNLSLNCDDETNDCIAKISLNAEIFDSKSKDGVKENDCDLSSDYDQNRMYLDRKNLDGYVFTQDSVCTECRFVDKEISFFSSFNNMQRRMPSDCFLPATHQIIDLKPENLHMEEGLLQKRSVSYSPKRKDADISMERFFGSQNCLKRFKSEGSVSLLMNTGNDICTIMKRTVDIKYSNSDVLKDIAELEKAYSQFGEATPPNLLATQIKLEKLQRAESVGSRPSEDAVQEKETIIFIGKLSADASISVGSLQNEIVTSLSQNFDKIDSNCNSSSLSHSTTEEMDCIDDNDEMNCSKNAKSMSEVEKTGSQKSVSSATSENTIEEMYWIDATDNMDWSTSVATKSKLLDSAIRKKDSLCSLSNDKIIENEEIASKTMIGFTEQTLIDSMPSEMNRRENNPVDLSRKEDLKGETDFINTRATVDLESQYLTETQLERIETEDTIRPKSVVSVYLINDLGTNVDQVKETNLKNEATTKVSDDSVLEISLESEPEQVVKEYRIIEQEKVTSVHSANNSKMTVSNSDKVSEENIKTRNVPINLTTVNANSSDANQKFPQIDVNTKNPETNMFTDNFNIQLITDTQLDDIERQHAMAIKERASVNMTLIKNPNTSGEGDGRFEDDFGLEFLSESELDRVEEEAYMKARKMSILDSKEVNAKSVVIDQDIFYRPEQLNTIIENSNNDPVIPNWLTNPTPEPNYDKMKRAVQMKRQYIKKMLQEILRLSTIVSKVGKIIHLDPENSDTESAAKGSSQIQKRHPAPLTENKLINKSVELGVSGDTKKKTHLSANFVTTSLNDSEIFYVPQSSRSKYSLSSSTVIADAHLATINPNVPSKDVEGSAKFYEPQSYKLTHDAPAIFNQLNNVEFKKKNISSIYMESSTSNVFRSLKHNVNSNMFCKPDFSSVWYNDKEGDVGFQNKSRDNNGILKNRGKLESLIRAEYQLPRINPNTTLSVKDKTVINTNRVKPVSQKDTIFYSPDKFSSATNNCTVFPSTNSSQTLSPLNSAKRPSAYVKPDERELSNFRKNITPHVISDNDSIFYNGNKKKGVTFRIL